MPSEEATAIDPSGFCRLMKRYHSPVVYVLAALLIALVVFLKKSKKPSQVWPRIEERLAEGRTPRLLDDIRYANYWAGVANATLLGGLILSFPWWGGRRRQGRCGRCRRQTGCRR